jgi:hypothetical protein
VPCGCWRVLPRVDFWRQDVHPCGSDGSLMSRIPKKIRAALRDRARIGEIPCCEICSQASVLQAHHRRNQSQSGPHSLSNLILICAVPCHLYITEHPEAAVRNGWTIQGTQVIPAMKDVRRRNERVWLSDDGSILPAPPNRLEAI